MAVAQTEFTADKQSGPHASQGGQTAAGAENRAHGWRKLFSIPRIGSGPDLVIRLVTRGKWNKEIKREAPDDGFTFWTMRIGRCVMAVRIRATLRT